MGKVGTPEYLMRTFVLHSFKKDYVFKKNIINILLWWVNS